ncbi:ATP-binding protein [Flavobacterium sp. ACN6]|uniref:ATP-binding protein n=1 Tax=Flavobacterium sp. ACN6 TaxID=1920426 RepID=UPI000BB2CF79|nr:ATP-binding protein [Flavobacterium sp. ACN6]PBJ10118.1 Phytochrome-like protein cph1 [Flavobacterium sp. ACN6]
MGVDTQHSDQIFEIFKRLHGQESYEGSEIGLALCRKIVANHQEFLLAASELGKGSTFHVYIPLQEVEVY